MAKNVISRKTPCIFSCQHMTFICTLYAISWNSCNFSHIIGQFLQASTTHSKHCGIAVGKSKNFHNDYRFLVAFYSIHKSLHGKALCNHRKPISVSGLGVTLIINHWKSDTFTSSGAKKNEIVYTMISWIFIRVPGSHLFTFSKIVNRYQIEFNAF